MTKYYRSIADGHVYTEAELLNGFRTFEELGDLIERVTVKPRKPKRLKVGDRVVTTAAHFTGAGRHGTIIQDDGSDCPFKVVLDELLDGLAIAWARPKGLRREKP